MKRIFSFVLLISNMAYGSEIPTSIEIPGEGGVQFVGPNGSVTAFGFPNQQKFSPSTYPGGVDFDFGNDPENPGFTRNLAATSSFFSMVKDASNNLVVCGFGNNSGQPSWVVARYTSAGVLDTTFGNAATPGYYQEDGTNGSFNLGWSQARGLAIDPSGNILVCGTSTVASTTVWTLVSYTPSGTSHAVGTGFTGGVTTGLIQETELGAGVAYSISLSTTNPYIIYTGGYTTPSSVTVITTISYLTNGSRNPAYNP